MRLHAFMVRTDGEDRLIVAPSLVAAIEADYCRFLSEEGGDDPEAPPEHACREYYDGLLEQIVHVGQVDEIVQEEAP